MSLLEELRKVISDLRETSNSMNNIVRKSGNRLPGNVKSEIDGAITIIHKVIMTLQEIK